MQFVDILGLAAAIITTFTFLPQVIKVWKEKSAKNVSSLMFIIAITNEILWIGYGILRNDWIIIFTNAVLMIMAILILYFKQKFDK
jgi:MtN3 and saliva related transmembrane protein